MSDKRQILKRQDPKSLPCPECNYGAARVLDSRLTASKDAIRRRRACENCDHRFTTYESRSDEVNELRGQVDDLQYRLKTMVDAFKIAGITLKRRGKNE